MISFLVKPILAMLELWIDVWKSICSGQGRKLIKVNPLHLKKMPPKGKHLGLPLLIPGSKYHALADVKDRSFTKLSGWKAKVLSHEGRATLIRSVATSLPAYILGFFLAPEVWCNEVDSGLKNFWWGFKPDKSLNLTLKSWSSIYTLKSAGGLGFCTIADHNKALISKLAWKVATQHPCPWVQMLRSKYLSNIGFEEAISNPSGSWVWKSILKVKPLLNLGSCFVVGNGQSISVWDDPWIPMLSGFKPSPNEAHPRRISINTVDEFIDSITE